MRTLLLSLAACAMLAGPGNAQTTPKPATVAAKGDWTGLYVGADLGLAFGSSSDNFSLIDAGRLDQLAPFSPSSIDFSDIGGTFGPEAGYRWQSGRLVLGAEADVARAWFGDHGSSSGTIAPGRPFDIGQKASLDWLGMLRGSIGYAPTASWLLYVNGGLAVGAVTNQTDLAFPVTGTSYTGSRSSWQAGWTIGAGLAYRFASRWDVRLEYLRYDLGGGATIGYRQSPSNFHTETDASLEGNAIRLGIQYAFGDGPGSAAPNGDADSGVLRFIDKLSYELGVRYWYGFGSFRYKLYNSNGTVPLSQLTYSGLGSSTGEVVLHVDHPIGIFVDGFAGIGNNSAGTLKDEDYAGVLGPYSATMSQLNNGGLRYAKLDFGYNIVNNNIIKLGAFVGYGYLGEQMNAYGCNEIASNPNVCVGVSPGSLSISEDANWNFVRLGVAQQLKLPYGFRLKLEAAWIPGGSLAGQDHHWLRIDSSSRFGLGGPILQSGPVQGAQIEATLAYDLTPSIDLGAGARFWYLTSSGKSVFPNSAGSTSTQVTQFTAQHFGPFVQASVKF